MQDTVQLKHFERFYTDAECFDRPQIIKNKADTVGVLHEWNEKCSFREEGEQFLLSVPLPILYAVNVCQTYTA